MEKPPETKPAADTEAAAKNWSVGEWRSMMESGEVPAAKNGKISRRAFRNYCAGRYPGYTSAEAERAREIYNEDKKNKSKGLQN